MILIIESSMSSKASSVAYLARFFSEDLLLKTFLNRVYAHKNIEELQNMIAENPSDNHSKKMLSDFLYILDPNNYILPAPISCEDDKLLCKVHLARINLRDINKTGGDATEANAALNRLYEIWHDRLVCRYSEWAELSQNSDNPIPSFSPRLTDVLVIINENRQVLRD